MQDTIHNKSVDGLRGLAALNVVISHFVIAFFPHLLSRNYPDMFTQNSDAGTLSELVQSPLVSIFYNGLFPVILFFVLSGYVLARPYYFNQPQDIQKRFIGRYIRLNIPIAASIVLSFLLFLINAYSNQEFAQVMGKGNRMINYFSNSPDVVLTAKSAIYDSILMGESSLNPPLWSLRVEFIGTMLLLFVYLFNPHSFTWIIFTLLSIVIYRLNPGDSIFYIAILAGVLLNKLRVNAITAWLLLFVGVYLGAFQHEHYWYNWLPHCTINEFELWEIKAFYNTLGAICLTIAILGGVGKKLFESAFIQFLGRISFSIYLLHFLVLCSVSCGLYLVLPTSTFYIGINFLVYLLVCFGVSILFYQWVDKPSIRISKKFSQWVLNKTTAKVKIK